jgi:hypothetical protein
LQENIDAIKVKSDMDSLTEEDPIGIKTKEVHVLSAFCVKKAEPEVSLFYDILWWYYVYMFLFFF